MIKGVLLCFLSEKLCVLLVEHAGYEAKGVHSNLTFSNVRLVKWEGVWEGVRN